MPCQRDHNHEYNQLITCLCFCSHTVVEHVKPIMHAHVASHTSALMIIRVALYGPHTFDGGILIRLSIFAAPGKNRLKLSQLVHYG